MQKFISNVFSIDMPDGWTLSTLIFAGPVDEKTDDALVGIGSAKPFQKNLVITLEAIAADVTLEDYLKRQRDGLIKAEVDWQPDQEPETVQLADGSVAILSEHTMMGQGGALIRQIQLMRFKSGVAYTFIASDLEGYPFDLARDDFRKILLSVS